MKSRFNFTAVVFSMSWLKAGRWKINLNLSAAPFIIITNEQLIISTKITLLVC